MSSRQGKGKGKGDGEGKGEGEGEKGEEYLSAGVYCTATVQCSGRVQGLLQCHWWHYRHTLKRFSGPLYQGFFGYLCPS